MRRSFALTALAFGLLWAAPAGAALVELTYDAPDSCPPAATLRAEVESLLGRPLDHPSHAALRVRAGIERARSAIEPSALDRDRVRAALMEKVGGSLACPAAPPSGTAMWVKAGIAASVAAAFLAAALRTPSPPVTTWPATSAPVRTTTAEAAAPEAPRGTELDLALIPSGSAEVAPEARRKRTPAPSAAPGAARGRDDALAAEIAALREAQRALRDADPSAALGALDALESTRPGGVLRQERLAARVLSLCGAGRIDEARATARALLAESPTSPQIDRIKRSCAFTPTEQAGPGHP
jgi:hypothetical protein